MSRIAVVGGGITGLAAADSLVATDPDLDVVVFEAGPDLGGKVRSSELAGLMVDEGPDAFLARVPWGIELATTLGFADELVSPASRSAKIWVDGALREIPTPMVLGVPLDPETLAESGTVSAEAVAALRADLARVDGPVHDPAHDVSIGSLVRDRLGGEILERLVDPLVGGINAGDCDALSLDAAAPLISGGAQLSPSLARGLDEQRLAGPAADPDAPVFYGLRGGMARLIDRLGTRLGERVRRQTPVGAIEPEGTGVIVDVDGSTERFDRVIVATPAHIARRQISAAARELAAIEFASVVLVTLVYDPDDVPIEVDASGFLVPADQPPQITACSWASTKWGHLSGGPVVLRASLGRHRADAVIDAPDDEILTIIGRDLATTMGITAPPAATRISRWPLGFPQYTVGHLARVADIEAALAGSGIFVGGASYRGLGLPACINQGFQAASEVLQTLE